MSSLTVPLSEASWFSQTDLSIVEEPQSISVQIGNRPITFSSRSRQEAPSRKKNNITIRRDNKLLESLSLPTFSVFNMRSIWSKLSSLSEDMAERQTDFSILSEVWEKRENLSHKKRLEEAFEMKDLFYFSTARPGSKRGGGAAIAAKSDRYHVSKLNINIPKPLEVVWGMLRPKIITGSTSKIILCSFYSPPNSKKKKALVDHMAITINRLKVLHPKASFIIAGDENNLNEQEIVTICPSFRQLVLKPTRKNKTLTIVVTDLHRFFQ